MNDRGELDGFWLLAIVIFVIVLALCIPASIWNIGFESGGGEQAGYIAEMESSGIFWKPMEVRLISIEPTFDSGDTSWHYGVISKEVSDDCKAFMKNHTKAVVTYEVRPNTFRWEFATNEIITGIRPAEV